MILFMLILIFGFVYPMRKAKDKFLIPQAGEHATMNRQLPRWRVVGVT